MNLFRDIFVLSFLPLALTGCLFDSGVLWEDDEYHVAWVDTGDNRSLYHTLEDGSGVGKVEPTIIAVGSNDLYVVAQRQTSMNQVEYYYIKKSKQRPYPSGGDSTQGPFNSSGFATLKTELNLPDFEKYFD